MRRMFTLGCQSEHNSTVLQFEAFMCVGLELNTYNGAEYNEHSTQIMLNQFSYGIEMK